MTTPVSEENSVFRVLKALWAILKSYLLLIGALVTVLQVVVIFALSSTAVKHTEKSSDFSPSDPVPLTLKLDGPLSEKAPGMSELFFSELLGEDESFYLPTVRSALRRAAADELVTSLNIEFGDLSGSLAEYAELRRILVKFKASGKPINVYLPGVYNWNYYIASVADKITINPAGSVIVPGPMFQLIYFGEALRKLGLDVEVLRHGKYKSAFEPFIQNIPSPETLEQYGAIEDSLRQHLVESVATSRGKELSVVSRWFKQSIFTPQDAMAQGLVDAVGYAATEKPVPEDSTSLMSYFDSVQGDEGPMESVKGEGGIALIEAMGEIHLNGSSEKADENIIPKHIRKKLVWAMEDDEVKAVVLRISSPGGSAVAADMIWKDIQELATKKPLVVSMGAVAASGGYYMAAPAQKIIAEPTTITGSIGVIGMLGNAGPFKTKYGVSFHMVSGTERKNMFDMGQKTTAFDKALMGSTIDQVYQQFISKVAQGRNMPIDRVDELGQGRVYSGVEALSNGLVDQLGGLYEAFVAAKEYAGFDVNKLYPVLRYTKDEMSFSELMKAPMKMFKYLGVAQLKEKVLTAVTSPEERQLLKVKSWLNTMNQEGTMILWPGYEAIKL